MWYFWQIFKKQKKNNFLQNFKSPKFQKLIFQNFKLLFFYINLSTKKINFQNKFFKFHYNYTKNKQISNNFQQSKNVFSFEKFQISQISKNCKNNIFSKNLKIVFVLQNHAKKFNFHNKSFKFHPKNIKNPSKFQIISKPKNHLRLNINKHGLPVRTVRIADPGELGPGKGIFKNEENNRVK